MKNFELNVNDIKRRMNPDLMQEALEIQKELESGTTADILSRTMTDCNQDNIDQIAFEIDCACSDMAEPEDDMGDITAKIRDVLDALPAEDQVPWMASFLKENEDFMGDIAREDRWMEMRDADSFDGSNYRDDYDYLMRAFTAVVENGGSSMVYNIQMNLNGVLTDEDQDAYRQTFANLIQESDADFTKAYVIAHVLDDYRNGSLPEDVYTSALTDAYGIQTAAAPKECWWKRAIRFVGNMMVHAAALLIRTYGGAFVTVAVAGWITAIGGSAVIAALGGVAAGLVVLSVVTHRDIVELIEDFGRAIKNVVSAVSGAFRNILGNSAIQSSFA